MRLIRAAFAAVVLAVVIGGLPVALVHFGHWPITGLPSAEQWRALPSTALTDTAVFGLLTVAAWLVWALFTVSVVAELAAEFTGREPRPVPLAGPLQLGARQLVAAILMTVAVTGPFARHAAAIPLRPRVAAAPIAAATVAANSHPPVARASPPPNTAAAPATITVAVGDNPWDLAEQHLGNGMRWRELYNLNRGVPQPDGRAWTVDDQIEAGWILQLPPRDQRSGDVASTAKTYIVEPGDTLSAIAQTDLGDPDRYPEIAAATADVEQPDGRHLTDPNLIRPGWEVIIPEQSAPAPAEPSADPLPPYEPTAPPSPAPAAAAPAPAASAAPNGVGTTPPTQPLPPPTEPGPPLVSAPVRSTPVPSVGDHVDGGAATGTPGWVAPAGLLAGATALASWALLEARRRRGRRLRRSRAGEVLLPPDPLVAPMTVAVHVNADETGVGRLDAALRHLAGLDCGRFGPRPQVMLRHPSGDIDVYLAEPVGEAVSPWQAKASGVIWALAGDAVLPRSVDSRSPCPALVQLGTCEDGAELYADLEALGALGLDGPPEAVRQVARALTATVTVSPAAQLCRVLTLGFDPYGLDEQALTRLVVADSPDVLLAEAESTARPIAQTVDRERAGSSFRLRAAVSDEGWEPAIVIVAGGSLSPEQDARLRALGAVGGRGVAVVRLGGDAPWTLEATEPAGWWRLNPLGLAVRPVALAEQELEELAAFLADADAPPLPADEASVSGRSEEAAPTAPSGSPPADVGAYHDRDWRLMVRLLGPVDIVNRDGRSSERGDRGQPMELVAWMATHRGVATRTGAIEALWVGRDISAQTLSNAMSAARLLLRNLAGAPPDGGEWVPARKEGIELHPMVVTDVDLLAERVAYAKRVGPEDAVDALAGALPLLRGVPLEGQSWFWADQEHTAGRIAGQAVSMATELAILRLQAGDVRGALDATDVGLRVIPSHDQLTELSIRAWIASGDRRTALAVYESYERAAAARGEAVSPEITVLRDELLRPAPAD